MDTNSRNQEPAPTPQRFKAARFWEFNVHAAFVAGIGGAVLLCILAGIIRAYGLAAVLIGTVAIAFLYLFPGNGIAFYPYEVEVEAGRGLRLFAPFKQVFIPFEDVKSIRKSFLVWGWRVDFHKGRRVLTGFAIHRAFGDQGSELVRVIERELARTP